MTGERGESGALLAPFSCYKFNVDISNSRRGSAGLRARTKKENPSRENQSSVNDLYKPIVHSKCLLPQDHKPTSNWGNKCHFFLFLGSYLLARANKEEPKKEKSNRETRSSSSLLSTTLSKHLPSNQLSFHLYIFGVTFFYKPTDTFP